MYVPKNFKNEDEAEIKEFISKNGFGIIVSQLPQNQQLWATHIPLMWSKNEAGVEVLQGHISRANPQWKNLDDNSHVLVIFQGPHAYVSASWYNHENVSTWNYIAVHVYGNLKIIEGEALKESIKKLVDKYEANSENPISVENYSEGYFEREIRGLVGIEVEIKDVHAAYKLSQNRDEINHKAIIENLEKRTDDNSHEVAKAMKLS